jgi:hypothetical protein
VNAAPARSDTIVSQTNRRPPSLTSHYVSAFSYRDNTIVNLSTRLSLKWIIERDRLKCYSIPPWRKQGVAPSLDFDRDAAFAAALSRNHCRQFHEHRGAHEEKSMQCADHKLHGLATDMLDALNAAVEFHNAARIAAEPTKDLRAT